MKKAKLLFFLLLTSSFATIYGQYFPVTDIPDSLKTDVCLVVREDIRELDMQSVNKATEKISRTLTVMNKEGEDIAYLALFYDKNNSVKIKEISYYDSNGKKIRSAKQSEITDAPAYGSSQLFSDTRIKFFKPNQPTYPYTVKYEYETDMDNVISFGAWRPLSRYKVSAQHSLFTFTHPEKIKVNKRELNISSKLSEVVSNKVVETWELNNIKAIEDEPFDISLHERVPSVYLMPAFLIWDKYEGKANTWTEYGNWMYSLYKGRDVLSDSDMVKITNLLQPVTDTLEKIKTLYKYLQNNTRYVNITLGIGGYQPFEAKTVYETGYGDCKALTNYLYSLLEFAGINSYPALVSSGRYRERIFTDFPNFQQFDHVILCIPQKSDTIWLECTDQKIPFGFLGDFTDDRDVLLITDKGGKFAHTRKYKANDNIRSCRSEFNIDSTGSAICSIKTIYHGLQYDNISDLFNSTFDEQKKWLYSNSSLPSLQIKDFSISDLRGIIPAARITESEISKNFCSFSGNYMVLSLNKLNAQKAIQKMIKPRGSDILINRSSIDYDTLVYLIPRNYRYEDVPAGISINSKFGSYASSVTASDKKIVYVRKFTLLEGRYKADLYKELYDFILSISKADNLKMILSKKLTN